MGAIEARFMSTARKDLRVGGLADERATEFSKANRKHKYKKRRRKDIQLLLQGKEPWCWRDPEGSRV